MQFIITIDLLQLLIYNFEIELLRMDIETPSIVSLFQPLNQDAASIYSTNTITLQTLCAFSSLQTPSNSIKLVANTLFLIETEKYPQFLDLVFETKFEILYEQEKNINSKKIGISIYNQDGKQLNLYFQQNNAERWSYVLGKKLNQKGFHEMFRPIKKLGKGNFASVYEAQRLTDHQKFAVKAFCKKNSYSAKNGKESLINELQVLRQLNIESHKNVLKMDVVYESDNSIYVVFELLTGKTLFNTIMDKKGFFQPQQARTLLQGLLDGLRHIHRYRTMHRDLKPENIMLRGNTLEPVIVDFGLATNIDLKEYLFHRCGTPGYVAPQIIAVANSQPVDSLCDMFSLGSIFHILLTGKALFEGSKYEQVYRNNKAFNINLQGQKYKNVSCSALDLLQKMLKLNPKERISAQQALYHQYITNGSIKETSFEVPKSPTLTQVSSTKEKKKRGFLFF